MDSLCLLLEEVNNRTLIEQLSKAVLFKEMLSPTYSTEEINSFLLEARRLGYESLFSYISHLIRTGYIDKETEEKQIAWYDLINLYIERDFEVPSRYQRIIMREIKANLEHCLTLDCSVDG